MTDDWRVAGSYFESCNCDPICPCRAIGSIPPGKSTHGVCFGSLSWFVEDGHFGDVDLTGLAAVLSIWFRDDVEPSTPWQVVLYVDERGGDAQRAALADIFLGRAGGTTVAQYTAAIGEVHAVRAARIELDHRPRRWRIGVEHHLTVVAGEPVVTDQVVACGIPGFDHPGTEVHVTRNSSTDPVPVMSWDVAAVCGFTTDFDYRSQNARLIP